jgi:transglycosylase-like protein with SLT domain
MQTIAFCARCRGMRIGWNGRYVLHLVTCKEWVSGSSKLLILTAFVASLLFAFPTPSAIFFTKIGNSFVAEKPVVEAGTAAIEDPSVAAIDVFLGKHEINREQRTRIASAIVASGRKYNLDPRLIASVVIVESSGNPFAISESDSVGMMQIHIRTWGTTADRDGINLFKIEDNIDFGSRILKNYSGRFGGIWEGVKRYKGWNPDSPESAENVQAYIDKVRGIYTDDTPAISAN